MVGQASLPVHETGKDACSTTIRSSMIYKEIK